MPRAADGPLSIRPVFCVTGGGLRKPWYPETKEVEGVPYVKLDKWDRGLCMFVTNKALQLKSTDSLHHLNVPGFQTLLDKRQEACNMQFHRQMKQAAEQAGEEIKKVRRAREEDKFIAGSAVVASMPAITLGDRSVPATDIKMLWSLKQPEVWVELTVQNLEYVRLSILASLPQEEPVRRRRKLRGAGTSPGKKRRRKAALANVEKQDEPAPLPAAPPAAEEPEPPALQAPAASARSSSSSRSSSSDS